MGSHSLQGLLAQAGSGQGSSWLSLSVAQRGPGSPGPAPALTPTEPHRPHLILGTEKKNPELPRLGILKNRNKPWKKNEDVMASSHPSLRTEMCMGLTSVGKPHQFRGEGQKACWGAHRGLGLQ